MTERALQRLERGAEIVGRTIEYLSYAILVTVVVILWIVT